MFAYLMANLGADTWLVFGAWMLVGAALYFGYGRRNSKVAALSELDYRALTDRPTTPHPRKPALSSPSPQGSPPPRYPRPGPPGQPQRQLSTPDNLMG